MAKCLSEKTTAQMPHILRPHTLDTVSVHQFTEDGLYPIAETAEKGTPTRMRIVLAALEPSHKVNLMLAQLVCQFRTPVVSVAQECAKTTTSEFGRNLDVMSIPSIVGHMHWQELF